MNESLSTLHLIPSDLKDLQQLLECATSAGISIVNTPFTDLVTALSLAGALSRECIPNRDEGGWEIQPDEQLIASLKQCIEYYLPERSARSLIELALTEPQMFN
jgi:hypothetical protein